MTTNITKKTESVKGASDAMNSENLPTVGVVGAGDEQNVEHVKGEKSNHKQKSSAVGVAGKETAEMVIEPKSEYDEEGNEETVEDLTLDDEEMGMDDLDQNAGTSQAGEGSSQGYAPWQHDRSQDELLLAPQEAQQRDPQELRESNVRRTKSRRARRSVKRKSFATQPELGTSIRAQRAISVATAAAAAAESANSRLKCPFTCLNCGRVYQSNFTLKRHLTIECNQPKRFSCHICGRGFHHNFKLNEHYRRMHRMLAPC
uniref:Longitudinals lacking protein, isoforms H/M/V n=1 Tax=Zeugodacus cucurbitae TaxID=28588 RepID=A0A0A1XIQ9_ZEUCU